MTYSLKDKKLNDYSKEEIIEIINSYCKEQIELIQRKTLKEDSFELPRWSEYQAYHLGSHKAFQKLIDFLPDRENK